MPHLFPPSKGEMRWRSASYICVAIIGFYILWDSFIGTPEEPTTHIKGVVRVVWALFMVTAIPAAVASYVGRYRLEAVLLPIFGSALVVACFNGLIRIAMGEDELIPRIAVSLGLLCLLVVRGLQLHRVVKGEPWPTTSTLGV